MKLKEAVIRLQRLVEQGHGDRDLVITDADGMNSVTPCTIAYNPDEQEVLVIGEDHISDSDEEYEDSDLIDDDELDDLDEDEDEEDEDE